MFLTLRSDSLRKSLILLGTIDGQRAIVTIEKIQFSLDNSSFFKDLGLDQIKCLDHNDVYSWNVATIKQDIEHYPGAKVNLIYPATETHVEKYRKQKRRIIRETPEKYEKYVVPYIQTMKGDRIKWVYNILHNGVEADRVIFKDNDPVTGFVLLPDM